MKALIKTKKGIGNLELREVPEVSCLSDRIKIKVKAVGICGTDLHIMDDSFPNYNPPVILGHEFSGEIIGIGNNVKNTRKLVIGDRVGILPSAAIICGECEYCKSGNFIFCPSRKGMGHGTDGAMTEYICVREDLVYKLPENISFEVATLLEPLACCIQGVEDFIDILPQHKCLVSGPGPIGLIVLSLLKIKKCSTVLAGISKDKYRLEIGKKLGADLVVDTQINDPKEELLKKFGVNGFDVCFECSGAGASFINCIGSLRKMGSLVQIGLFSKDFSFDFNNIVLKQLSLYGSMGFTRRTWNKGLNLLKEENLKLDSLISHTYELNQWEKAFAETGNSGALKVVIKPGQD